VIEFAASVTLMVVVVGGAILYSVKNGLRERIQRRGRYEHRA
jgi:hypothetical protein